MYDLMVLMLMNINSASSALDLPWVIRARTSDSRSVKPSARPGQSRPGWVRDARRGVADHGVAGMDRFQGGRRARWRATSWTDSRWRPWPIALSIELRVEVPRVDDDTAGAGVGDEHLDVVVVGFGLGERVVEDDVDVVDDRLVGGDLGDDDAVAVAVEQMGEADHHDVVVVDERDGDRRQAIDLKHPKGCTQPPTRVVTSRKFSSHRRWSRSFSG